MISFETYQAISKLQGFLIDYHHPMFRVLLNVPEGEVTWKFLDNEWKL